MSGCALPASSPATNRARPSRPRSPGRRAAGPDAGVASTIRSNRNSWSSTPSSSPVRSAPRNIAVRPSRRNPSARSRPVAQDCRTTKSTMVDVGCADLAGQQAGEQARPVLGRGRRLGEQPAQAGSLPSSAATLSSSLPSVPSRGLVQRGRQGQQPAGRGLEGGLGWRCAASALQVGQEPLDRAVLPGLVVQRLTDDLAGQLDRDAAEVSPQFCDDLGTLGIQLGAPGGGDPLGLGMRLGDACRRGCAWACALASSRILAASSRAPASCCW